jgi:predicted nuclease with TOPRIM domain
MLEQVANYAVASLAAAGSLVAGALYLRKIFRGMGLEDSRGAAEKGVIDTLREEVGRLASINAEMSKALTALQLEIIKLRNENISLMGEIAAMKNENASLTKEVLKLNEQLARLDNKCEMCDLAKAKNTTVLNKE